MPSELFDLDNARAARDTFLDARRTATLLHKFLDSHRELKSYKYVTRLPSYFSPLTFS